MTASWKWLLPVALACALAGWAVAYRMSAATIAELKQERATAQAAATSATAALDTKTREMKALQASLRARQSGLNDAIKASPGWAGDAVPDAVFDSLFGTRPADPARIPAR